MRAAKAAPWLGGLSLLLLAPGSAQSQDPEHLRNWFDDPFFQATAGLADCPEPAGPRVTAAERQQQSHRRAEKGTTCWLAGERDCERHNAFAYDREIAAAVRPALQAQPAELLAGTTLWITVQGRVVYIEGCASRAGQGPALEALIRGLPHVQQALALLRVGPAAALPYRRMPP